MARSSRRSALLVLSIVLACGCLGMLFGQKLVSSASSGGSDGEVRDSMRSFSDVYRVVQENYAEPVNPDKAIYNGAIPGMLRVLDPHSNFFDPKSYAALREEQRGKYYGVGMQVGPRNNKVIVIAPFAGAPAYRVGIRPGDVIIAVDGKQTDNMSTSDVAELLKGPKGTSVKITVLREGSDKPLDFTVIRDEIPRYSVDVHFLIRPGIGYIHISGFQETTEKEVRDALDEFGDIHGLILDLRQNPGGLLSEGVGQARHTPGVAGPVPGSPVDAQSQRSRIGDIGEHIPLLLSVIPTQAREHSNILDDLLFPIQSKAIFNAVDERG